MRRGVRYYRAVPPPETEWESDYPAMAAAGLDFVVVPVPWSLCHLGDDEFDFGPLLRQLDLARRHGLGLVAAVDLGCSPSWLIRQYAECLCEDAVGRKMVPRRTVGTPPGGLPGLCLDSETARLHARAFLQSLASAVARHPALQAYDLTDYSARHRIRDLFGYTARCHCPATRERFVAWLRETYRDDLGRLARAWRVDVPSWSDASPPPAALPNYLEVEDDTSASPDWQRFQAANAAALFRWCRATIEEADAAHAFLGGEPVFRIHSASELIAVAREATDWGCPFVGQHAHTSADFVRGLTRPKRLWATGIPTHTVGGLQDAHWELLCSGVEAAVYEPWRPDHLPGFYAAPALVRPDGSPSERLREVTRFGQWLAAHPDLARARLAPPEAAIVLVPEFQELCEITDIDRVGDLANPGGLGGSYWMAIHGAYEALTSRGARAEFRPPDALGDCPLAYLPMAYAVGAATADALRRYVAAGGCLVAEAGIAQYDEHGELFASSPGYRLDALFGARAPDLPEPVRGVDAPHRGLVGPRPMFKGRRATYPCYLARQPLDPTTGKAKATFVGDGSAAIVDNSFEAGTTRLIGTHPSAGADQHDKACAQVVLDSLAYAKVLPRVLSSSPDICVRLLEGDGVRFLCAFNTASTPQEATISVNERVGRFRTGVDLITGKAHRLRGNGRRIKLGPGEGLALRLDAGRLAGLRLRPRWRRKK